MRRGGRQKQQTIRKINLRGERNGSKNQIKKNGTEEGSFL